MGQQGWPHNFNIPVQKKSVETLYKEQEKVPWEILRCRAFFFLPWSFKLSWHFCYLMWFKVKKNYQLKCSTQCSNLLFIFTLHSASFKCKQNIYLVCRITEMIPFVFCSSYMHMSCVLIQTVEMVHKNNLTILISLDS